MSKKMKPMIYERKVERKVLCSGKYKGIDYYILTLGTHPTAYINLNNSDSAIENILDGLVHGGITYQSDYLVLDDDKTIYGYFVGWDYSHYGDYSGAYIDLDTKLLNDFKKWTTEEILSQVKSAIDVVDDYRTPLWKKNLQKIF